MTATPPEHDSTQAIRILFEEYRALYGLAEYRLSSLEHRAAGAWAILVGFLTGFASLASDAQAALLMGTPLALVWLLRTTVNHARSFEDALRRLDEIERTVNHRAGEELLVFQSRHPSRGRTIGGRTGHETVLTVVTAALLTLASCGFLVVREIAVSERIVPAYGAYLAIVAIYLVAVYVSLRYYRYQKAPAIPTEPPV